MGKKSHRDRETDVKRKKKKDKKRKSRSRTRSASPKPPPSKKPRSQSPPNHSSSPTSSDEEVVPGGRVYSVREIETIVEHYLLHIKDLDTTESKAMPSVRRRDGIWRDIAKEVSKVHGKVRTGASCQEKLKKLRSALKLEG